MLVAAVKVAATPPRSKARSRPSPFGTWESPATPSASSRIPTPRLRHALPPPLPPLVNSTAQFGDGGPSRRPFKPGEVPFKGEAVDMPDLSQYPAEAWAVAVSPRSLDALRRRVAAAKQEENLAQSALQEESSACEDLKRRIAQNRQRVRALQGAKASEVKDAPCDDLAADGNSDGIADSNADANADQAARVVSLELLRTELDVLADDISTTAAVQLAKCKTLTELRTSARIERLRREGRVAMEVRRRLQAACRSRAKDVAEATEATSVLVARAAQLRVELSAAEAELKVTGMGNGETEALRARLVSELAEASQQRRADRVAEVRLDEAKARLQSRAAGLRMRLTEMQAANRRLAESLQDRKRQEQKLAAELEESRLNVGGIAEKAKTKAEVLRHMQAELKQQRDATAAWLSTSESLACSQKDDACRAAQALQRSRKVLAKTRSPAPPKPWPCQPCQPSQPRPGEMRAALDAILGDLGAGLAAMSQRHFEPVE